MSKEEKMMILEMVAQGKITPEQGVELLKAVSSGGQDAPGAGPKAPGLTQSIRETVDQHVREAIDESIGKAREAASKAAERAQEISDSLARKVEETAQKTGTVVGGTGNLAKMIFRVFSGGFPGQGPQYEFHEEVRGELPSDGEIDVSLRTTNGRITVEAWDEPGYLLDVTKKVNATDEEEARKLLENVFDFSQEGLILRATSREGRQDTWGRNLSVGFNLKLPKGRSASLNLDSANGRITVDGISGARCVADTANGRIEVSRAEFKSAKLDTANGRIEFEGSASDLKMDTANGRIEAKLKGAGTWKCDTANGKIDVEIAREEGVGYEVDISSSMGRLDVSGMGDVEVLVDETKQRIGSKRYKARTKDFENATRKASLKASSAMGRVTVSF